MGRKRHRRDDILAWALWALQLCSAFNIFAI